MSDVDHRGIWMRGMRELCTIFTVMYICNCSKDVYLKIILKHIGLENNEVSLHVKLLLST